MQILVGILVPLIGDFLDTVAPIIFLILYGIFQLLTGKAEAKKKVPQPRMPRPQQPPELPGKAAPVDQADALRGEVEEFLRRAQGKPPKKPAVQKRRPKPQPAKPRRLVPAERPKPNLRREGVSEHVAHHISSSQIAAHAERLGDKLESTHDRVESLLHEKFDHQIGTLQRQSKAPGTATPKTDLAAEIAELLSKPEGMRQLIVAQEILRRPERW